jgi:hypothetical protein
MKKEEIRRKRLEKLEANERIFNGSQIKNGNLLFKLKK